MNKLTREQVIALKRIYDRNWNKPKSYLAFRRTAHISHMQGCVMLPWCGMTLGIERDGHTHS
jgi:hypothetical protein